MKKIGEITEDQDLFEIVVVVVGGDDKRTKKSPAQTYLGDGSATRFFLKKNAISLDCQVEIRSIFRLGLIMSLGHGVHHQAASIMSNYAALKVP